MAPVARQVLASPGRPLDPETRAFFEPRFGYDFDAVRVHTDARAAESAGAAQALAYTVGRHIVFGSGHFAPTKPWGRRLLAHELAHVVQHARDGASPQRATEPLPLARKPAPGSAPSAGQPGGTPDENPALPPVVGQPVPGIGEDPLAPTTPVEGRPVGTPDERAPDLPQPAPGRQPYLWTPIDEAARNAAEWDLLAPIHKYFDTPSLEYYETVREALLAMFGAGQDGASVALQRMLDYYRDQIVKATFQGFHLPAHKHLAAALERAEAAMSQSYALASVGGLNIRVNANNSSVLSDHSYGSALDINGSTNPNVKDMKTGSVRAGLIEAITGADPSRDAEGKRMSTDPRTFDEMLAEADRLSVASRQLTAAFADEASLVDVALRIATERGDPQGETEDLAALMFAAAEETGPWTWEPYPQPAPGGRAKPPKDAHRQALAAFLFPIDFGNASRLWDANLVTSTTDLLAAMARIFRATFAPTKKDPDRRVPPTARTPSDAQLALHGFLDLPPEMVAALSGSDAGNLRWLGMMSSGTKDYMHFELRERPDLY